MPDETHAARRAADSQLDSRDVTQQNAALEDAVSRLLEGHASLHARVRCLRPGDEHAFTEAEAWQFDGYALRRRRASGSVRQAARELCASLGLGTREFLRDADGVPEWPQGWLGSFSHDDIAAVAVFGASPPLQGLGIDIEDPATLDAELVPRVLADGEREILAAAGIDGKAAFSIKEAVFKATYPADRIFLEFAQVRLDPAARTAVTSYGRIVHWRAVTRPRMVALAWW